MELEERLRAWLGRRERGPEPEPEPEREPEPDPWAGWRAGGDARPGLASGREWRLLLQLRRGGDG